MGIHRHESTSMMHPFLSLLGPSEGAHRQCFVQATRGVVYAIFLDFIVVCARRGGSSPSQYVLHFCYLGYLQSPPAVSYCPRNFSTSACKGPKYVLGGGGNHRNGAILTMIRPRSMRMHGPDLTQPSLSHCTGTQPLQCVLQTTKADKDCKKGGGRAYIFSYVVYEL